MPDSPRDPSTAKRRAIGVRHTASVEARTVVAARTLWRGLVERYEGVARQYQALKAHHLDADLFRRLVLEVAAPVPAELNQPGLTARQESARQKILSQRSRITGLWHEGAGHSGDQSAWEAYNAVAESVDHDAQLWRVRDSRAEAMLVGRLAEVKDRVLGSLVEAAGRRSRNLG